MNILIAVIFSIIIGIIIGYLISKTKFKGLKKTQVDIEKQAFTDPLTGGKNRHLFMFDLDKLINKEKKFAVCFMDLDGFKQINDTMGHDAGDELLIGLSTTFLEKLPQNVTSYRIGGDEFALIIENIKTTEDITNILDNLRIELNKPFIIENTSISLEYSLGIAIFPEDASTKKDLVTYADDAMYYIKEHGKNDYYFHNKVLKAKLDNKTKMEKELKRAFEKNEFMINFQPRINIIDTNKVQLEALLCWKHPVLGEISSEYFIRQAEEMSLIIKLDENVLRLACQKLREIKSKKLNEDVSILVNLSNSHVKRKNFVKNLCDILAEYNIKDGEIYIEFTDDIDISKINEYKFLFDNLKKSGANIIINNFQIKYVDITLLKTLPIDGVKLIAQYVSKDSQIGNEVLKDIVKLSKDLDFKVSAVAIDEEEQLTCAIKNGADYVQGNLICKTIKASEIDAFFNEYTLKKIEFSKSFKKLLKIK